MQIVAGNLADVPRLSGPVDDRRFVEVVGERIALLGHESGVFECWMWPLKVCHDLRWTFPLPAGSPPSGDGERVREVEVTAGGLAFVEAVVGARLRTELFACRERRGIVLTYRYEAAVPSELTLSFVCDFRPMWPAGMGAQIGTRDPATGAFLLTEELGRFATLVGGPTAGLEGAAEYHALPTESVQLRVPLPADGTPALVFIAGAALDPGPLSAAARRGLGQSATGLARAAKVVAAAREEWSALVEDHGTERRRTEQHWTRHFAKTTHFASSDSAFDEAMVWAKVAIERAWVTVDGLGRGLVAGLAPSRGSERPGYGWFFDGDALIAARAMAMYGDFEGVRDVLRFAASHQREDGKLMHELTLSANLCAWLEDYPYAYYKGLNSSDFVLTLERYVRASGDLAFARELFGTVVGALRWCEACTEESGRISVKRAGIAAVEAGPLSDSIISEVFLQGAYIGALRGAVWLAEKIGEREFLTPARDQLARAEAGFEGFWSKRHDRYGFALLEGGGRCDDDSAYLGFPLSLGCGRPDRAFASARRLNEPTLTADWGARMFATDSSLYDPKHYNTGAVFPFLTGYAIVALYRHGLAPAAHQLLASQVALTGFGARGMIEEHLVGDRAEIPDRGVPHQIFSSCIIPEAVLRGVLGLDPDATVPRLDVRTSLPPSWGRAVVERLRVGKTVLDITVRRTREEGSTHWHVTFARRSGPPLTIGFAPLVPPLSRVIATSGVVAQVPKASGAIEVGFAPRVLDEDMVWEMDVVEGPDVQLPGDLPARGEMSRQPRLVSSESEDGVLTWCIAGRAGTNAVLPFHCDEEVEIEGAEVVAERDLLVAFPAGPAQSFTRAVIRVRPRHRR